MTNPVRFLRAAFRLALASAIVLTAAVRAASAADAPDASAGKKVNINQASAVQLAYLPRVGAKAAERIVEYRKAHGTFAQAEQLMEVKGVGEKLFTELKPYVTLTGPTTLTAKVRSGSSRSARASKSSSTRKASSSSSSSSSAPASSSPSVPEGKGR
jgi:competence protein ComEA